MAVNNTTQLVNADSSDQSSTATLNSTNSKRNINAASALTANCVYKGIVYVSNIRTGLVDVLIDGIPVTDCQVAANAFGALIGVSDIALPPEGAEVLVLYFPGQSYVVGANVGTMQPVSLWVSPVTGAVSKDNTIINLPPLTEGTTTSGTAIPVGSNNRMPIDLLPGERSMDSNIGSAFRLLLNLAQMSSGDLAKVETCLLNDMVRIVDNYFVHHSVGGDDLIWGTDGKCTREEHFTSWQYEAEGSVEPNETIAGKGPVEGTYNPASEIKTESSASQTGRWRKSTYMGFLGDMVHTFVTRPTELASTYMEGAFRGCNFRQWIGTDGTYMVQSAAGIQIELTPNIVCPSINYAWNDPEFNVEEAMQDLDDSFLRIWGNGPDWHDLNVACWQMRSYLKYIPLWHSLARFRQLKEKGYCDIPTEQDAPKYSVGAGEKNRERITGNTPYKGHASILLDPSGSVSITSNNGASIIMNQGNIQIACEGNLELKAGKEVIIQGRDVVAHAARRFEIVSFFGSIIQKARTAFDILCEKGRLYLKSDAKEDDETNPGVIPEEEVQNNGYGVIIDASQSKALLSSAEGTVVGVTGDEKSVYIESAGKNSDIRINSNSNISFGATDSIYMKSQTLGVSSGDTKFTGTRFKVNESILTEGNLIKMKSRLWVGGAVEATAGYAGPSKFNSPRENMPQPDMNADKADTAAKIAAELTTTYPRDVFETNCFLGLTWSFDFWLGTHNVLIDPLSYKCSLYEDTYLTTNNRIGPEGLLTDQIQITLDDTELLPAPRTKQSLPWPGKYGKIYSFDDNFAPPLTVAWENDFKETAISNSATMKANPYFVLVATND